METLEMHDEKLGHDERFAPLARTPLSNATELETDEDVVEVRVAWGDDVLLVKHVRAGERFVIGEGDVDWLVPASLLGAERHVLVEGGRVHLPASAKTTGAGDEVTRFHLGDFEVRACRTHAGRAAERGGDVDRRPIAYVGATLALAGLMIVGFSLVPPKSAALSFDHIDPHSRLAAIFLSPPEVELEEPVVDLGAGPSGGEGGRHDGDEGAMGDPEEAQSGRRYAVQGPRDNPSPTLARDRSPEAVAQVGALGALRSIAGTWNTPTSPYGAATAVGQDPMDALGALFGAEIGSSHGALGLGLHGTGRGAGGTGRGTVGLDSLGDTLGHGAGATCDPGETCQGYGHVGGLGGMARASRGPVMRPGVVETNGGLSKETIRRVVRRHHNEVKFCYEQALHQRPDLEGRVTTRFMISPTGAVAASVVQSSTLGHGGAEQCITQAITRWSFPAPSDGGMVSVTYPFVFSAAD
jgi:TonB family protein